MKRNEKEIFETASVREATFRLALPSVIGQIILVIYNMADTFFIGMTGSDTMITAVTVCMPAFMFLSAIANLFGVGGSSVISRALGSSDRNRAEKAASFAFYGCLAVTLLYSAAAFLFMNPFVDLIGGSGEAHAPACTYLLYTVVLGGVPTAMNNLLAHLIRSEGDSFRASAGITLGGIANIFLDPLFMFVILQPGSEAKGAAAATMISNLIALGYYITVLLRKKEDTVLIFDPKNRRPDGGIAAEIINAGLPACLMTLCENISYAMLDKLMSIDGGTAAQAGIGVAKKVNMLAHCMVRGMAQGVLPLIGYCYGSGNYQKMRRVVRLSGAVSLAISGFCTLCCLLFGRQLIAIFIPTASLSLEYGTQFLKLLSLGAPFSAFAYTCISFFQATGHGRKSLILALSRKGIIDIPLMLALRLFIPVYGIVAATPLTDLLCCVLSAIMIRRFMSGICPAADSAPQPVISLTPEQILTLQANDTIWKEAVKMNRNEKKIRKAGSTAPKKKARKISKQDRETRRLIDELKSASPEELETISDEYIRAIYLEAQKQIDENGGDVVLSDLLREAFSAGYLYGKKKSGVTALYIR